MLQDYVGLEITQRELNILQDLHDYRVMTTEQIRKKHFPDTKQAVNYVLHKLRKRKIIRSRILKGARENRKGPAFHRLTEAGLQCLVRHGKSGVVADSVQNLYVKPSQLHYTLLGNDIAVELTLANWGFLDSREIKRLYNIDDKTYLKGSLIDSIGETYGYFVLEKNAKNTTIGRIQSEIRSYYNHLHNFIVFIRGRNSYAKFIDQAINRKPYYSNGKRIDRQALITGYSIKLVPFDFGLELYSSFPNDIERINTISKHYNFEIVSHRGDNERIGGEYKRQAFDTIINYNGEEMYLVDLIDTNLKLVHNILSYNEHEFKVWNNERKVLVVTCMDDQWELIKGKYTYVERLDVDIREVMREQSKHVI